MSKKRVHFIVLLIVLLFFSGCKGWNEYIATLQECFRGLAPYWVPNSQDGPGTILQIIDGAEHLKYSQKVAFPNLVPEDAKIPTISLNKVSKITFEIGAKLDDKKVLPQDIEVATNISYTKDTELTLFIKNPVIKRIQEGLIAEELKGFDLKNLRHMEILNLLKDPSTRLISGALLGDGFTFTFKNVSDLNADIEGKIKGSLSTDMEYKRHSKNNFSLTAKSPMYMAYYSYPIKPEELDRIIVDLTKKNEIETGKTLSLTLTAEIDKIINDQASLPQMKASRDQKVTERNQLEARVRAWNKEHRNQWNISRIRQGEERLNQLNGSIAELNNGIIIIDSRVAKLKDFSQKLAAVKLEIQDSEVILKSIKDKKYDLFGEEVIVPLEVKKLTK